MARKVEFYFSIPVQLCNKVQQRIGLAERQNLADDGIRFEDVACS